MKPGRKPGIKLPNLRHVRETHNVTARELALLSGVPKHTIYKVEAGSGTSRENVRRIQHAVVRLMRGAA